MPEIEVSRTDVEQFMSCFHVRVTDADGSATDHDVTLSRADHERLATGYASVEAFVRACFEFLLERESKASILRSFDVSQIATYFPEFDQKVAQPPT